MVKRSSTSRAKRPAAKAAPTARKVTKPVPPVAQKPPHEPIDQIHTEPVITPPVQPEPDLGQFKLQETTRALDPPPTTPTSFDLEEDDVDDAPVVRVKGSSLTAEEQAAVDAAASMQFRKIEAEDIPSMPTVEAERLPSLNDQLAAKWPDAAPEAVAQAEAEANAAEFQRWQQSQLKPADSLVPPPEQVYATANRMAGGLQPPEARPVDAGMAGDLLPAGMNRQRLERWKYQARQNGQFTPVARQAAERGLPLCFVWKGEDQVLGFMTPAEKDGVLAFNVGVQWVETYG